MAKTLPKRLLGPWPHLDEQRIQLLEDDHRRCGVRKLLRQVEITEARIRTESDLLKNEPPVPDDHFSITDTLVLELETYYTVAADLLDLTGLLLAELESKRLKKEAIYKTVQILRNPLTRHAYNKPNGDVYAGLAWNDTGGPMLKGGSPFTKHRSHRDPGFCLNSKALKHLIKTYGIELLYLPSSVYNRVKRFARILK